MMGIEGSVVLYATLLALLFAAVAVWAQIKRHGKSWVWNVLTLVAGLTILAGMEGLTSHAKPMYLELQPATDYRMLRYISYPQYRIYLFVLPKGQDEPRLYTIPWTQEAEDKIAEAVRVAKRKGYPPMFYYGKDVLEPHPMPTPIILEPKPGEDD